MKLQITKEFSTTFLADRYCVSIDGIFDKSFKTLDEALDRLTDIKNAKLQSKQTEVVYTEDF